MGEEAGTKTYIRGILLSEKVTLLKEEQSPLALKEMLKAQGRKIDTEAEEVREADTEVVVVVIVEVSVVDTTIALRVATLSIEIMPLREEKTMKEVKLLIALREDSTITVAMEVTTRDLLIDLFKRDIIKIVLKSLKFRWKREGSKS